MIKSNMIGLVLAHVNCLSTKMQFFKNVYLIYMINVVLLYQLLNI